MLTGETASPALLLRALFDEFNAPFALHLP
jgi:hypothetical protein